MKILLDENLPRKLKFYFSEEHEIFTVADKGLERQKKGRAFRIDDARRL